MINKCDIDYSGPSPKTINQNYPDHTYDTVTCLLNGEPKRIIQERYLRKYGYTKQLYLQKFSGAPLKSLLAVENYRRAALNDGGRRSKNLRNLNLTNLEFQSNRQKKCNDFWKSERSLLNREKKRRNAKEQHKNGQAQYIREYFSGRYIGSEDQKSRSERMKGKNNIVNLPGVTEKAKETYIRNHKSGYHATKKQRFKNYDLQYQSSYEFHFLEYCEINQCINLVSNPIILRDDIYPRRYYLPDYIFNDEYVIEIKSWYIESKQLKINPNVTIEKQSLVERLGYKWLYILDKNYIEFDTLIKIEKKC